MKIFIALFEDTLRAQPYVYTYTDVISRMHPDVSCGRMQGDFWTDKISKYDIVHIMWPNCFTGAVNKGGDFAKRLQEIKEHHIAIVVTCHNLQPHANVTDSVSAACYDFAYRNCDVMIHLGETSKKLVEKTYSQARHVVIPHHVYDEVYTQMPTREESIKALHLRDDKTYILAFGVFRSEKERDLIRKAARQLRKENVEFLAPSFYMLSWSPRIIGRNSLRRIVTLGKHYLRYPNIKVAGKRCSDEELLWYYGASKIAFIQRTDILNSGNVPLGYLMGKVVVGPKIGNIAELLQAYGNPTFDPTDTDSVINAIRQALRLADGNKGIENREKAIKEITSSKIAQMHYQLYSEIIRKYAE